jgi:simple sugar transport system substrate-binding protein
MCADAMAMSRLSTTRSTDAQRETWSPRGSRAVLVGAALIAVTSAASSGPSPAVSRQPGDDQWQVVAFEPAHEPSFRWDEVRRGMRDAAQDTGLTLSVRRFPAGERDPSVALASLEDGTDAVALALQPPMAWPRAIDREGNDAPPIAVVSWGVDPELGGTGVGVSAVLTTDDRAVGSAAGERFTAIGVQRALCVLDESATVVLDRRCDGAIEAMRTPGSSMDLLAAFDPAGDPSGIPAAIAARLVADPAIDGVLATNPTVARAALDAVSVVGPDREVIVGVIDADDELLDLAARGRIAFAMDLRPYLQGYLAITTLAAALRGQTGSGPPVLVDVGAAIVAGDE